MSLIPRIMDATRERGLDGVLVFAGGIIPDADIATLTELGVSGVFTPGSPLSNITEWLEGALDARETQPTT